MTSEELAAIGAWTNWRNQTVAHEVVREFAAEVERLTAEVERLTAENAALREQVAGLVERVAAQSDLLSRAAERQQTTAMERDEIRDWLRGEHEIESGGEA